MKKRIISVLAVAIVACLLALTVFGGGTDTDAAELSKEDMKKSDLSTGCCVHDPQVLYDSASDKYYMYGTHMTGAAGDNLTDFQMVYDGVRPSNKMFSNLFDIPEGKRLPAAFSFVGKNDQRGYSVWAPSIIYDETMGKYLMYFCTTSSFIKSSLCLATADSAAGPYTFEKILLSSGFSRSTGDKTDFYEVCGSDAKLSDYVRNGSFINTLWPNCIDPAPFYDRDGRMWMTYGSWSGGIFLLELDPATGDVIHPDADPDNGVDKYYGYRLIGGGPHAIEGPYITYDPDTDYYYLFVSYGNLQANGGYQIREFRSKDVTGPYVDEKGEAPNLENGDDFNKYGVKVIGNYSFPSQETAYKAPGGQSVFTGRDGNLYIVYHQRFDNGTEDHEPRVHRLYETEDGWLVAAPFEVTGEGDTADSLMTDIKPAGTWYLVKHRLDVTKKVRQAKKTTFNTKGTFEGDYSGSFTVKDNSPYITVELDGVTYQGVLAKGTDEAGNSVIYFTAVGNDNESLWGVHYVSE